MKSGRSRPQATKRPYPSGIATTKDDYSLETYILSTNHYQIELLTNLDQVPEAGAIIVASFSRADHGACRRRYRSDFFRDVHELRRNGNRAARETAERLHGGRTLRMRAGRATAMRHATG